MSFSAEVEKEPLDIPAPRIAPAPASSKFGSPPDYAPNIVTKNRQQDTNVAAGRLPEEVYEGTLPPWRAALRRQCVAMVEWECVVIAEWQAKVRSPFLDKYFVYASMLGTHTFFLVFLPMFFFFGHDDLGRGLSNAMAFGVYLSSLLKDMVCSPRPYAPPVVRLSVGTHHLEYGFPSTHCTNGTSLALFLGAHIYDLYRIGSLSATAFAIWIVVLIVYVVSIVGSRVYTGMHGFTDCSVGIILGVISWLLQHLVMPEVEKWALNSGWSAPLITTSICLLLVNQHPSPVDDCPCFEDAIAFVSVFLGINIGFWCSKHVPALNTDLFSTVTPGASFDSSAAITTWLLFALLKLVTGILIIFSWRILAKPSVQTLLPPLFRWLAWASPVRLPHRRHYTPATEYVNGPPHTLRAVPSMIDLDLAVAQVVDEDAGVASGRRGRSEGAGAVKRRGSPSGFVQEKTVGFEASEGAGEEDEVKHYDADVLTKVVVYIGIGTIATVIVPAMFEALGWGV